MEKQNLIFYQFDRDMGFINTICKDLEKKGDFEISFVNDYSELGQITSQLESMIVVFRLIENHDLAQTVGTLQATKEKYKEGLFRAICIQQKPAQRKVERLLRNLGCNEFFDTNTNPRTIRFKIDFLGRGIKAAVKQKEHTERRNARAAANSQENEKAEDQVKVNFVRPLAIDSDIWILKAEDDYKKVLGRWLFHLIGPSSRVGAWEFIESRDQEINGCWKYVVEPDFIGKFITEEGAWFFKGNRPDFDWKTSRWKFSSQDPQLFFKPKEGESSYKIKLDEKNLLISKNSESAMLKEKEILETCDGRFAVNKDQKEDGNELSYMDRVAKENEGNLEGKGSSEYGAGNLKGKNSSENNQGPLKGKAKGEAFEGEDQEAKERKGFKEESDNDLSGKGSKSDKIDGHLKGGLKKENKDELENKDKSFADETPEGKELEITEDEISASEVKGKVKIDLAHKGDFKGSVKKEKEVTSTNDEDKNKSNKTDKIDGHLKGGLKKENKDELEDKDKSFADETPEGKELEITEDKISEGKELEITEDKVSDGEVQGKLKTDKAHQGELKGGVKNKEAAKKDMDGHSEVDDIDAHFKSKEKYNADKSNKNGAEDFSQDKKDKNKPSSKETPGFKDETEDQASKEGKLHTLKTDKVSAKLKGKISQDEENIVNLESGTIASFIKINNQRFESKFEDIMEDELYVQLDKGKAQADQKVTFSISFTYGPEEVFLEGDGVIGEVEADEDFDFVIIDIDNVNKTELEKFLQLYSKRQESINQFLSLAKGA